MIINVIYTLEAYSGYILKNKYTGEERFTVENETDIDAWEEVEYNPINYEDVQQ